MKKQSLSFLSILLIVVVSANSLFAVPDKRDAFNIEVPFEFQIGKRVFEAGKYQIFRQGQNRLIIENRKTRKQRVYLGNFDGRYNLRKANYKLRFNKYGKQHFLRTVVAKGSEFSLPKTKAEKKAKKYNAPKRVTLGQ